MDLKTFVSDSLVGIVEGVRDARERTAGREVAIAPPSLPDGHGSAVQAASNKVFFDVAVSLSEKTDRKGAFEIVVLSLNAGFGRGKETAADTVSRIRFDVDITFSLPPADE